MLVCFNCVPLCTQQLEQKYDNIDILVWKTKLKKKIYNLKELFETNEQECIIVNGIQP